MHTHIHTYQHVIGTAEGVRSPDADRARLNYLQETRGQVQHWPDPLDGYYRWGVTMGGWHTHDLRSAIDRARRLKAEYAAGRKMTAGDLTADDEPVPDPPSYSPTPQDADPDTALLDWMQLVGAECDYDQDTCFDPFRWIVQWPGGYAEHDTDLRAAITAAKTLGTPGQALSTST